jgi:hypothetical protein
MSKAQGTKVTAAQACDNDSDELTTDFRLRLLFLPSFLFIFTGRAQSYLFYR